jgi:hypothetical protein
MPTDDIQILRDLATRYMEIAHKPVQEERRTVWRRQNSLKEVTPPIYVRAFAFREMPESRTECQDPFFRHYERTLREAIYRDRFADDFIIEPWISVRAAVITPPEGLWGLPIQWSDRVEEHGSHTMIPTIVEPEDAERMVVPHHVVDEEETARRCDRLSEAIGDIVPLDVDRKPAYFMWAGDISTHLTQMRGLEQLMLDMLDRPEWLHGVLAFMRDGILRVHQEAEEAGHWTLSSHQNQAAPYAEELPDPAPNSGPVGRRQLWYYMASQETTLVGPRLFDEFMLQYQIPIMAPFGLAAYGCCEDLTKKIPLLQRIPNLRRIAAAPAANVARCAEQIGDGHVLSYRPSPADMVGYGFDPDRVRNIMRADLQACRANGCHVDVTLKDVETVQGDPTRVPRWVEIAREVIDEVYG